MESLLSFYKDGFCIRLPTKFDMPLNKETDRFFFSSEWHFYTWKEIKFKY